MSSAKDRYREGYELAKEQSLSKRVTESVFSVLRDDSNGHFGIGYGDGMAGRPFKPPSISLAPYAGRAKESPLSELEKVWYALCRSHAFLHESLVADFGQRLRSAGKDVAFMIGLHDFTRSTCAICGEEGQFKIRFLGRIEHPECKWIGYMGSGAYLTFQVAQVFHSGIRAGGSMKSDADAKGDRTQGWINAFFGFLFTGILRALLVPLLFSLHLLASLAQSRQTRFQVFAKLTILAALLTGGALVWRQSGRSSELAPSPVTPGTATPPTIGALENKGGFSTYRNGRFGFTLSYPSYFVALGESANGDGQEFASADGARLAVWGSNDVIPGDDPTQSIQRQFGLAQATPELEVTYKVIRKDFYVVSGYMGSQILYQRETLRNGEFFGFRLLYDRASRSRFDSLPAAITKSLAIPK